MAKAYVTVDLTDVDTSELLEELEERSRRKEVEDWLKIDTEDSDLADNKFIVPDSLSIIDEKKFEFFHQHYKAMSLEALEQLAN